MARLIILIAVFFAAIPAKAMRITEVFSPLKIITISIDEKGRIFIGRDTLTADQLSDELQKRLWGSYLGTDRMYDAIHLEFSSVVSESILTGVKKAIHEAQKKSLTDLCLQKHKKLFEDLNNHQQRKIRKQFPVLFQQEY
jgi:biopolymer transport protein ExbD